MTAFGTEAVRAAEGTARSGGEGGKGGRDRVPRSGGRIKIVLLRGELARQGRKTVV